MTRGQTGRIVALSYVPAVTPMELPLIGWNNESDQ